MPKKKTNAIPGYDFSDRQAREETAGQLFARAKTARTFQETEWIRYNDYYNFIHSVSDEIREAVRDSDIGWNPAVAVVPDPFIMVESQVDPVVPEPEFRGRDDDLDSRKAKQREYAVKFVCQNNRLKDKNTSNERRMNKYGDSFWKVFWDPDMPCGPNFGDIRIIDVPVDALYIDPTAGADGLQAAQYVAYLYRMHKVVFWRTYGQELRKEGMTVDSILESEYTERGGIFDLVTPNVRTARTRYRSWNSGTRTRRRAALDAPFRPEAMRSGTSRTTGSGREIRISYSRSSIAGKSGTKTSSITALSWSLSFLWWTLRIGSWPTPCSTTLLPPRTLSLWRKTP